MTSAARLVIGGKTLMPASIDVTPSTSTTETDIDAGVD